MLIESAVPSSSFQIKFIKYIQWLLDSGSVFLNLAKPHKKRLAASLRTSLIQYMVGPVGLEPTTKGL